MLKKTLQDCRVLLRSIPSPTGALFTVAVVVMNLLANKELISLPYLALDCGFCVSWVSFLCMDMICKRFGAKASVTVSILALLVNLAVSILFWLMSLTPGMWGAYYSYGSLDVNAALNATFAGSWYVVFGSSCAMVCSSVVNSFLNVSIGEVVGVVLAVILKYGTGVGLDVNIWVFALIVLAIMLTTQFVDNFVFAAIVSHNFFGWTWAQVIACSLTGAVMELLCEVFLSPVGFRVVKGWERDGVGEEYLVLHPEARQTPEAQHA